MHQLITSILFIIFAVINVHALDKKTKYKDDNRGLSIKYYLIFYFTNIFCYLFLKKIREKRKLDYYIYYSNYYKKYKKALDILTKYSIVDDCNAINYNEKTYKKIVRYLKISKLKK